MITFPFPTQLDSSGKKMRQDSSQMREYTFSKEAGSHFNKLNTIRKVTLIPWKNDSYFYLL